jgi:hypothetical protein
MAFLLAFEIFSLHRSRESPSESFVIVSIPAFASPCDTPLQNLLILCHDSIVALKKIGKMGETA